MAARTQRGRGASRPGWLVTLFGVTVLVCTGFALGVVMGVVIEEPGLVLGQLTGPSETVPWSADAQTAGAGLPSVAASVPSGPAAERYSVQVGAFRHAGAAESIAEGLRAKGFPVHVTPAPSLGDGRWRVLVGPVASRSEADEIAGRLKAEEKLPTWVRSE